MVATHFYFKNVKTEGKKNNKDIKILFVCNCFIH